MKFLPVLFILFSMLILSSCKSSTSNPVTATTINSLSGKWTLTSAGVNNDSLNVVLNINGTNGNLAGTGSGYYVQYFNGGYAKSSFSGTISGTYTASTINAIVSSFDFSGDTSGANYAGTATVLVQDTNKVTFYNDTLYKAN